MFTIKKVEYVNQRSHNASMYFTTTLLSLSPSLALSFARPSSMPLIVIPNKSPIYLIDRIPVLLMVEVGTTLNTKPLDCNARKIHFHV